MRTQTTLMMGLGLGLSGCLITDNAYNDKFNKLFEGNDTANVPLGWSVTGVSLSPETIATNDTLTASVEGQNGNGDQGDITNEAITYEWHRYIPSTDADEILQVSEQNTLDGTVHFDKGDEVYVIASINGTQATSESVTVSNTPPSAPVVSLSPETPTAGQDELLCSIDTPATDDDDDAVTYTYVWRDPSGSEAKVLDNVSDLSDSLSGSEVTEGEWSCEVTADDGEAAVTALVETVMVEAGESGCSSLSFDGVDDYVEIPDADGLDIVSEFTVSAWFRVEYIGTSNDQFIVSKGRDNSTTYSWGLAVDNVDPVLHWVLFDGATNPQVTSSMTIQQNKWYHVVGTYDGSEMVLYINGVEEATTQVNIQTGNQLSSVEIGKWPNQNYYFNGEITEVGIWNTALTSTEVEMFENGSWIDNPPVAFWTLHENQLGSAIDQSGNEHNGTINGATWVNSCPEEDLDGDGVAAWEDCDDNDSNQTTDCCAYGDCDYSLDLGNGVKMDMNLIPSGEDPLGRYTLTRDFYLMTTEVTQGMFQQIMGYDSREGEDTSFGDGADFPAYYVNWHMAAAFANAVTQRHNTVNGTSLLNCYSCSGSGTSVSCSEVGDPYQCTGYVLPTEAEWEYAARSGTTSELWTGAGPNLGGTYSENTCGNTINDTTIRIQDGASSPPLSDYAWFCGNQYDSTYYDMSKPVGLKLPNGFGLYDMHGNLWEWNGDWDGCSYPQSTTDPHCNSGSNRKRRGGYWRNIPINLPASYSLNSTPTDRQRNFGFRIGLHP